MKVCRAAGFAVLVTVLSAGVLAGCGSEPPEKPAASPTPTVTSSPTPSPSPTSPPAVAPSTPLALYVPRIDVTVPLDTDPCPVVDDMLDPDRDRLDEACYYVAPDKPYSLPGTDAPDIAVFAGHTSRKVDAAFNWLYDWTGQKFSVELGDELWVRTEASGSTWLVYTAESLHTPNKLGGLAEDTTIWGTEPVPGRLLTIGCLQPLDRNLPSSENVVVVWTYESTHV